MHIVKKVIKTAIFLILVLACVNGAQAQRRKITYLQTYDWAPYHFGFLVGTNFMDYTLILKENYQNDEHTDFNELPDDMNITENGFSNYYITNVARETLNPGFTVGVVGDLRLGNYFNLRFCPTYSFNSINIEYTLDINNQSEPRTYLSKHQNVNCLEFPLHIKYRSKRYNNIAAYLLGGFNPKLYFTFPRIADANWIQTKPFDLALEFGSGFDFYNQWFKMGVEVKMGFGLFNILREQQPYFYGHPLEGLRNKQLQVSLTFE